MTSQGLEYWGFLVRRSSDIVRRSRRISSVRTRIQVILAMSFVYLACMVTHASANLLTNGSFELGTLVNDGNATQTFNAGPTSITGWSAVGRQMSWIEAGNPFLLSAEDGSRFLDLTAYNTR